MSNPVFTVIIPTRNRPHLLPRAVKSVLSQTFSDLEVMVVDDAGDVRTADSLMDFGDDRIVLISHGSPGGVSAARNTGIGAARGTFVTFLDDDDEYLPRFLEKLHELFRDAGPGTGFAWTGAVRVENTADGEKTVMELVWPGRFESAEDGLAVSTAISNSFGLCVRRECLSETGGYDESLEVGEDTDLVIRLSEKFGFRTVPEILVKKHRHGDGQLTDPRNLEARMNAYRRIINRHKGYLSRHWKAYYVHSHAYAALCYSAHRKGAGRRALLSLAGRYPQKAIVWADLVAFELTGKDWKNFCRRIKKDG